MAVGLSRGWGPTYIASVLYDQIGQQRMATDLYGVQDGARELTRATNPKLRGLTWLYPLSCKGLGRAKGLVCSQ
jgi:hypothetical protein